MNRIMVVGDSLFSATLCSMLAFNFTAIEVANAPDVPSALSLVEASPFDAAILADAYQASLPPEFVDLMSPSLPVIIHTSLQTDFLGVFYYQRVNAGVGDLVAILELLATVDRKADAAHSLRSCRELEEGDCL